MHIFIMRHGEAANTDTEDSVRPLTKVGIIETTKMGAWLAIPEMAINSGLMPETLNLITPSGNPQQVHDFIDGFIKDIGSFNKETTLDKKQGVLFVSHMPFVSYFVAELTNSSNMPLFATGTIAIIDYDIEKMHGELVGMVSPENAELYSEEFF